MSVMLNQERQRDDYRKEKEGIQALNDTWADEDKMNVALLPLSGNDFFLHESIEMVSSYNRSNRLRMQKKRKKRNNKYNSIAFKPFLKSTEFHTMFPFGESKKRLGRSDGQKCLCGCGQKKKKRVSSNRHRMRQ